METKCIRFRQAVSAHSEPATAGAIGTLTLVQIAMKPISQTRCRPDANGEQKRNVKRTEELLCSATPKH